MEFNPVLIEKWHRFRQTTDAFDTALSGLEERARASGECIPLTELLEVQRLILARVQGQGPFLERPEDRVRQPDRVASVRRFVQTMEDRLRAHPDDCVPHDIAAEQIALWRRDFEEWRETNLNRATPWTPVELEERQRLTQEEFDARKKRLLKDVADSIENALQQLSDESPLLESELDQIVGQALDDLRLSRIEERRRAGFDLVAQRRFLWPIIEQCKVARRAYALLDSQHDKTLDLLVQRDIAEEREDDEAVASFDAALDSLEIEAAMAVQAFLTGSANVSKCLWPSGHTPLILKRGARLKELLCVDDGSILRDRKLRNFFEHFDERLDRWAMGEAPKNLDASFGVSYGPETDELGFHDYELFDADHSYSLRPILRALIGVEARAAEVRTRIISEMEA